MSQAATPSATPRNSTTKVSQSIPLSMKTSSVNVSKSEKNGKDQQTHQILHDVQKQLIQAQSQSQQPQLQQQSQQTSSSSSSQLHHHNLHQSKPKLVKSLKLISVSFKELALDSPTFRAYVNHSFNQIDGFRIWIENLLNLKKNYNSQNLLFENSLTQMRNLFESSALTDGIIDSDYTSLDLNFTFAGFKEMLAEILKFTRPNDLIDKLTNELIQTGLLQFTTVRRKFETTQNMHDLVLSRYCGIAKTRDAVAAREDALQLGEIRKQYIELSLDTAVAITDITRLINNYLIEIVTLIWRNNLDLKILTKNYNSFNKYVERIHQFEKASRLSMDNLRKDMLKSKNQTVETALRQHAPSKELSEYDSAAINPSTMLNGFEDSREEKHGWLFMKTTTGEPSRQVWVRRWCFVKDGIFGMFSLSPSKTFVQELDKIGVGLCNIRYCAEEDRRFCFELKTISNTIILQAETLHQLKGWFYMFNKQKTKFIESGDEIAFNRYPPVLREFVCTAPTTSDQDMTTVEGVSSLSELVHNETLKFDVGLLSTIYNAPICTLISKEAIAAHGATSPTNIPTAITANIWGSVNWGSYYLLDKKTFAQQETPKHPQHLLSEDSFFNRYPSYYPNRLVALDCQLRSLLGTVFPQDEFVLLEFRAIWIPNTKQELVGRCYVTQNCVYFYMSSLGFVSLILRKLKDIISFESISDDNFDTLKIYELNGLSMKLKLYLDSARLLKEQMTAILHNKLSDHPKPLNQLLKELENLRSAHAKQEIERLKINYEAKKEITPSVVSTTMKKILPLDVKTNYNREMKLIWDKVYDIPSKLLFHILLGDESFVLQKILPFIDARNENISMAMWNQTDKHQLKRSFMTDTILDTNEFRTTKINQTIESLINSKYYNILQKTQYFKFPGMNAYRIETRVIIYSLNLKNSKLLVYSKIHFDEREKYQLKFLNFFTAHFLNKVSRHKVENLDADIKEAVKKIGPHVKVIKLIRLFGPITKNEHAETVTENDSVLIVSRRAFSKVIVRKILNTIFSIICIFFNLILQFFKTLRLNYILVLLLGLSFGYNLLLTGKSVRSYWVVSRAENMIDQYVNDDVVSRAIYLKDVEELVEFKYSGNNSKCFEQFQKNSLILNPNSTVDNELKKSYRELGLQRNRLLVNLKMINDLEYHLLELEWNNFLTNELQRCDLIAGVPLDGDENIDELKAYCASCQFDFTQTQDRTSNLVE